MTVTQSQINNARKALLSIPNRDVPKPKGLFELNRAIEVKDDHGDFRP